MSTWNVTLTKRASKQLLKLPTDIQDLADMAIADLETQGPVIRGWDVRKMAAQEYLFNKTSIRSSSIPASHRFQSSANASDDSSNHGNSTVNRTSLVNNKGSIRLFDRSIGLSNSAMLTPHPD
jgi:hypothetical protein